MTSDQDDRDYRVDSQRALKALKLYGYDWDGTKGLPMRQDVADLAFDLLFKPVIIQPVGLASLPMPTISLNSNGTLSVDFVGEDDNRRLMLTFECEGVVTYVKLFSDGQTMIDGVIRVDTLEDFASTQGLDEFYELLCWVVDDDFDE